LEFDSAVDVGVFPLSDDLEIGTSGGMSLGGGVRKLDFELLSLLPGETPSLLLSAGLLCDLRPSLAVDLALGDSVLRPPSLSFPSFSFFSRGRDDGLGGTAVLAYAAAGLGQQGEGALLGIQLQNKGERIVSKSAFKIQFFICLVFQRFNLMIDICFNT
jgi:hypothetical protein